MSRFGGAPTRTATVSATSGQILYITKLIRGQDLGFYRELDNTGRLGQDK
jgi:hypothetical protein